MSTRLRVSVNLAVVTKDGGVIREQSYGSIYPEVTEEDAELLAKIVANTVRDSLPDFLNSK